MNVSKQWKAYEVNVSKQWRAYENGRMSAVSSLPIDIPVEEDLRRSFVEGYRAGMQEWLQGFKCSPHDDVLKDVKWFLDGF